jgi:hypothetical protein
MPISSDEPKTLRPESAAGMRRNRQGPGSIRVKRLVPRLPAFPSRNFRSTGTPALLPVTPARAAMLPQAGTPTMRPG